MGSVGESGYCCFWPFSAPDFITANVDNDSGGILTYSQAGAQYGYTPAVDHDSDHHRADRGAGDVRPHGRGHRQGAERPDPRGVRAAADLCADDVLVVVNYTNVVTEFIGIAGSLHLFHVTKFISVPFCAALVWYMVVRGSYKSTEKIFIVASVVYIAYIFAGVLSQPSWHDALLATVKLPANRCGATRPTSTWRSAWWAPRLLRGCSSICSRRLWRRAFASRITRPRGWT